MPPNPDFGSKRNQREGIFELERPFGGLVPEHHHADEPTDPAAKRAEYHKGEFRYALTGTERFPFVETKREECHRAERGEPDGGK